MICSPIYCIISSVSIMSLLFVFVTFLILAGVHPGQAVWTSQMTTPVTVSACGAGWGLGAGARLIERERFFYFLFLVSRSSGRSHINPDGEGFMSMGTPCEREFPIITSPDGAGDGHKV